MQWYAVIIQLTSQFQKGLITILHNISEPVLRGHPVLHGHYWGSQGCLLNAGFTVTFMSKCHSLSCVHTLY